MCVAGQIGVMTLPKVERRGCTGGSGLVSKTPRAAPSTCHVCVSQAEVFLDPACSAPDDDQVGHRPCRASSTTLCVLATKAGLSLTSTSRSASCMNLSAQRTRVVFVWSFPLRRLNHTTRKKFHAAKVTFYHGVSRF